MKMIVKNIVAVAFFAGFASTGYAELPGTTPTPALAADKEKAQQYTCPMHPEVVKDASGKCPKCGMKLIEKGAAKNTDLSNGCCGGGHGGGHGGWGY